MDTRQIAERVVAHLNLLSLEGLQAEIGEEIGMGYGRPVDVSWVPAEPVNFVGFGGPMLPGEGGSGRFNGHARVMISQHCRVCFCGWFPFGLNAVIKALEAEGIHATV